MRPTMRPTIGPATNPAPDPTTGAERWRPSVTVAAVIAHAGRYLLVEEHTPEGLRLNNPAGHLDPGESPLQGVVRETLEETARLFAPEALVGVYLARFIRPARDDRAAEDITYLRFAYCGAVGEAIAGRALDTPVVRTLWLTPEEIAARRADWRSDLVGRCIADHRVGRRYPLELVQADASLAAPPEFR
jgi:8-oxo-dGTP pyrophosphatase MutT (NUDIX family)